MAKSAHQSIWRSSEVLMIIFLVFGGVLEYMVPIQLTGLPALIRWTMGVALIFTGVIIFGRAKKAMSDQDQSMKPGATISQIVDHGIYRFSRHPLYLAIVVFMGGVTLLSQVTWWYLLFIPLIISFQWILIAPEERFLSENFPEAYEAYKRKTRMWI